MESRFIRVVLLAVVASACSASSTSVPVPATILVVPDSVTLRSGQTLQLVATVLDGSGSQITGVAVTFTSLNAAVASVTPGGVVTAGVSGATTVVATAGPASTTVPVVVRPLPASTIVASPAVGGCPHGIAVASTGVGYVTQVCVGSASRFQMSPPSPTGNLEVGSTPSHVALAPGGATAYIVNQYGRRLTIMNTETNTITDTVPLGHEGYNVAVAPNGARVYVTTGDGWVMEVNAVTRAIVDSVQVGAGANG